MTPCIIHPGQIDKDGYGRRGSGRLAHRVAWEEAHGPIPAGLEIDHLCRNRACVNVGHMELVTHAENMDRMRGHNLKSVCNNNHEYTPANTYLRKSGQRTCRACGREAARRYRANRKEKTA